jgi:hypothetical protein
MAWRVWGRGEGHRDVEAEEGMSQLEVALRRLEGAVARLEAAVGDGASPAPAGDDSERDRLVEEVERLREQAAEDTRLRVEAARAVRSALHDLRGAIGRGEG